MGIDVGKRVKIVAPHSFYYDSQGIVTGYNEKHRLWNVKLDLDKREEEFGDTEIQTVEAYQKHNEHYKKMGIQPFDVVETWELAQRIGCYRAFTVKYLMRLDVKEDALTQAEKALECCQRLVDTVKRG